MRTDRSRGQAAPTTAHLVLVVGVVRVAGHQEVELHVVALVCQNAARRGAWTPRVRVGAYVRGRRRWLTASRTPGHCAPQTERSCPAAGSTCHTKRRQQRSRVARMLRSVRTTIERMSGGGLMMPIADVCVATGAALTGASPPVLSSEAAAGADDGTSAMSDIAWWQSDAARRRRRPGGAMGVAASYGMPCRTHVRTPHTFAQPPLAPGLHGAGTQAHSPRRS